MVKKLRKIEFKSTEENLHLVEKFVEEICDDYNIYNSYFGNIIIALTEATTNAIFHGNKGDNFKTVIITFESKKIGLTFMVEDQGEGFDYKNIPDPTDITIENSEKLGKGIFLIKSLADEVNFYENGKVIEIIFKIASINNETTIERINMLKAYSKVDETKKIKN
ncbi:MAG: ATP-binding protein [Saprospiraceae bacterium]|nr:ATP-binding protein [Saprospiraceae bacterium]